MQSNLWWLHLNVIVKTDKKQKIRDKKGMYRVFVFASVFILATGCATITRGTKEAFVVETIPSGASVSLSNGLSCRSPCSLLIKRRGTLVVNITKPGYQRHTSYVASSIDGGGSLGMAGNVFLGGLIGAGVDAGTGAMHRHKPNPLRVTLIRSSSNTGPWIRD